MGIIGGCVQIYDLNQLLLSANGLWMGLLVIINSICLLMFLSDSYQITVETIGNGPAISIFPCCSNV